MLDMKTHKNVTFWDELKSRQKSRKLRSHKIAELNYLIYFYHFIILGKSV